MSFLGSPPSQARKPFAEVLPDGRKKITRWFRVTQTGQVPPELDWSPGHADIWPDAPTGWTGLLLTYLQMDDAQRGFPDGAKDAQPLVRLIFEQISPTGETQTGGESQKALPDGRDEVTFSYVMFSSSTYTQQTPGTSTAPSPFTSYYLWEEVAEDDGTLRNITRRYQTAGTVKTTTETLYNGALLRQTISTFKTVPSTPSGYTAVGTATQNPDGYPVYDYSFVAAAASGAPASSGQEVSREYLDAQGGTTAFDPANPGSGKGAVRCVIKWITGPSVTTDPTTGPASFVRYAVDVDNQSGFKIWTVQYAFANTSSNLIVDEVTTSASTALVVYHRVAFGAAPATPSATIGGTVTLFESSVKNDTGYLVYDYRWSEGDGRASITTRGESDGALVYTVVDYTAGATTPAYPGSGTAYLVSLTQKPDSGYYVNTAVYQKPPATVTFRKTTSFLYPGLAAFSGAPVVFNMTPPVTQTILASVEVSYATSQITTTPFSVTSWAKLNTQWIPYTNPGVSPTPGVAPTDTTTGPPQGNSESLGGYIAGASGISDTNQYFNGVFVATYSATLSASTPSTRPTGATTLAVDNDPYLLDTSGTIVYRRTVTTYTF